MKFLINQNNDPDIRECAYNLIFQVTGYRSRKIGKYKIDLPMYSISNQEFDGLINWAVINSIILDYSPEIFDKNDVIDV